MQTGAQEPPRSDRRVFIFRDVGEQVQVERIAYYSEKIGLTTEEAQLFWPIYNEMDNKKNALFEERAAIMQRFTNANNMSDRQIDEQLNRLVAIQQQEMALPAEYDAKFRKVLSSRKVMNLYVAEMGFRTYLLQRMRDRRPDMPDVLERRERQ
jgi:hypothetical protein